MEHLDMSGVRMACISYLDIADTPAHLRYLVKRLHQRLPNGALILVGLWPSEDPVLRDTSVQSMVGADLFTSTISDTVDACVNAARQESETGIGTPTLTSR